MSGYRKRVAQGLVATIVLCALGFMICGSFASPGNIWEQACIGLVIVMLASLLAAVVLAAATYLQLLADVRNHLRRPSLSDEEFAVRLGEDVDVDRRLLGRVRAVAAACFPRIGGDRFYPEDRLDDDLHLRDVAPFAMKAFYATLEAELGLGEYALRSRIGPGGGVTFGDLVLTAVSLAEDPPPSSDAEDLDRSGTL